MHRRLLWLLLFFLTACAGPLPQAAAPTAPPALLPVTPAPTQPSGLAPTVVAAGARLPGRLLFVRDRNVWMWQDQTGTQLTDDGDTRHPAWSPDGTQIVVVQRGQSYSDLVLLPAAGGEPQRLTDNGSRQPPNSFERIYDTVWAFYPAFAPDGRTIAFASQYGPPYGSPAVDYHLALFLMPAQAGGDRRLIYADETGHVGRPVYAPDGSAIVFAFGPAGAGTPRLLRYDLASDTVAPQPGAPEQSYDPAFSPDGRWLAFAVRDGGRTDIFAVPSGGGSMTRLSSLGTARAPAFSPDGRLLAFLAIAPGEIGFDLWVADVRSDRDGIQVTAPRQVSMGLRADADSGLAWGR
ncbi:MAG: PD40 domain-containing protein [Chloroflexi bacterium]|nr:PD40 domain-containing protein [Chloroflexota bacterium]